MPNYVSNKTIEKLKYDLVRDNFISFEKLSSAEELSEKKELNLFQTLIEESFIEEEVLLKFIQDNLRIPYVNLEDYSLDEKCLAFISADDARKYKILPLFRIENSLTVAMADPLDLFSLNNLMKHINCDVEPIICSEKLILEKIDKYYFGKTSVSEDAGVTIDWRDELNEEAPDIKQAERIVNSIISQALLEKIFEIVFDNTQKGLSIKFRQNNGIEDKGIIPFLLSPLCVTHLKNSCHLDIAVSDIPQIGKFSYTADIEYVTGIVSTFPSVKGERIVIRLYSPPETLEKLSIEKETKEIISKSLEKPGIILIAGSKLSGKSFFAYTLLNSLDLEKKNVMTIESIVKYNLKGVNQCELNEKVGFSAEKALKFIDFQSPDIVYVEEIVSGKLFEGILSLANSGKLIITEVNAEKMEDLSRIFNPQEFKELEKSLNCAVTVKDLDVINVINLINC